jgi:Glycosyltransferase family 87
MATNRDDVASLLAAILIWCTTLVGVLAGVLSGRVKAIPFDTYYASAQRWLAHQPLYETRTIDGFQYFPHAALLFAPFTLWGAGAANIAWRTLWWVSYGFGMWRVGGLLVPARKGQTFLIATCLALGPAVGGLSNGQANLALAALTLHVAAELIAQRWWRATLLLAGGLALKPLMLPLLLIVWVLWGAISVRLPIALLAVSIFPLLLTDVPYCIEQYTSCVTKLSMTATPDRLFEDVRGLLASLGWLLPHPLYLVIRALAAAAALWICRQARRNVRDPQATVLIAALAVGYLMLFNPRTLSSSYTMTSCMAGLFAAAYLFERQRAAALTLVSVALAWTVNRHWPGFGFIKDWLKPAACVAFDALLIREVFAPLQRWALVALPARATTGEDQSTTPQPSSAVRGGTH